MRLYIDELLMIDGNKVEKKRKERARKKWSKRYPTTPRAEGKKLENAENWECVGSCDISKLRI